MAGERIRLEVQEREQRGSRESRRLRKRRHDPGRPVRQRQEAACDQRLGARAAARPDRRARPPRDPRRRPGRPEARRTRRSSRTTRSIRSAGRSTTSTSRKSGSTSRSRRAVVVELVGESARRQGRRRALPGRRARCASRRSRSRFPSGSSSTSARWRSATRCASSDLPAREGVTYLDDPETVLATVTVPDEGRGAGAGGGRRGGRGGRGCARARRSRRARKPPRARPRAARGGRGRRRRAPEPPKARAVPLFRRGEPASTLDLLVAGLGNPGPRVRRDAAQRRLDGRRRARPAPRRLLALEVLGPAGRAAASTAHGLPCSSRRRT